MKLSTYKIVIIYFLVAGLWIALSDEFLHWFISDSDLLTKAQSVKGFAFVLVTGLLLYFLVSRYVYALKKSYQQEQKEREEREAIWRCSSDGILGLSVDGTIFSANEQAKNWLDISLPTEKKFWDVFEHPYCEQIKNGIKELTSIDRPDYVFSIYGKVKKGNFDYWFEIRLNKSTYNSHDFIVGVLHNITEKIQHEEEVELLKTGFEQMDVGIALARRKGKVIFVNEKLQKLLNKQKENLLTYKDCLCVPCEKSDSCFHNLEETLEKGKVWHKICEIKSEDHSSIYHSLDVCPVSYKDEHFVIVIMKDITQQILSEKRLSQQYRMESLGYLASGIAHDFNNILGAILGHVDLILGEYHDHRNLVEEMDIIRRAVLRGRDMTSQVVSVSRENGGEQIPIDINNVINEVLTLIKPKISTRIKLDLDIDKEIPKVLASPGKINQILLNLCLNACRAMVQGGTLVIKVEVINADETLLARHPELVPGKYIRIIISDSGVGIDPEIMEHIFEPFFTTQGGKGGSGIGLYVVRSLVNSLGGGISVYSDLGKGTRFCVYLPVYSGDSEAKPLHIPHEEDIPRGKEKILIVDDEPMLAGIIGRLLIKLGYQVRIVNNPRVAKELIEQGLVSDYDLAIIDNIMPEITGEDIILYLQEKGFKIPIVLTSGMVNDEIVEKGNKLKVSAILEKPCTFSSLGKLVRKVLDENFMKEDK
ncbi:MAG TPA: ATP-binding protein [Candidatus Hydrogenedens sp.]|nr:ATP-binding protein [Candidatus Hydrogenedens sp.]